jgi:endonuclease YncB( thermonuclease family)
MSRHWEPPRRPWTRADAYVVIAGGRGRLPAGAKAGLVLVAAACVGVGIGSYQAFGPRQIVAPEAAVAPKAGTIVPAVEVDPADAVWAERAEGQDSPSTSSGRTADAAGVRASFSYCKWGGGTNCVVDGDTFYVDGAKVRIADIDAPETHDYRCASELELGERAARQLQALLNSGAVTMSSIDRDRDRYGRLLRNVSVNGQDVGETLISAGVARAYAGGRRPWC